jgi:PAS domain S-box-containing protein
LKLDPFSLEIIIACVGLALAAIFLSLRTVAPKYRGFYRWAISDVLISAAFALLAMRPRDRLFSGVVANTLIVAGVAALSNGVWAFLGRAKRFEPLAYVPPIAAAPVFFYFSFAQPGAAWRIFTLSFLLCIQFGATAAVLLYKYPLKRKSPARFTAALFIGLSAWFAYGCVAVLAHRELHSASLLFMAVGIVGWTLGLGNMTSMRLAEELAAQEQEAGRLRQDAYVKTIIDAVPQSIVMKDRDGRILACNAAFARSMGRTPEEIRGLLEADLYSPELAEKYADEDRDVIAGGATREFIERHEEDGRERWTETIKTPLFGPDGRNEGIIVVFRDITERKKDEDRLQESERRYRELSEQLETRVAERTAELQRAKRDSDLFFDLTLDYVCLTDFKGRFLKLSPSWSKNLGWSETELMNRTFMDFIHHDDRVSTLHSIKALESGARITDKANRFKRADGSWVWLSWSAIGLPDRGVVMAAAHDIPARVETEERLRNAGEVGEAASRSKSQFISTMSHELRTPLNAVLGYAGLLAPLICDERGERYIRSIDSSGRALLAIINDLLDLTKVESGRIELTPAPFDPRQMMDEIAEIFRFGAEEKGLYLEFKASAKLPRTLLMDGIRLRQILINLIGNSIKFTEHGAVRVFFDAESAAEPGTAADGKTMFETDLSISVEDTGIGMSESYRARLFEPFSQQDAAIARKYGGTGLGLAIAKRLLDLMDGTISCESEQNRGTRFRIRIPRVPTAGSALEVVSFIGGGSGNTAG